MIQKFDVGAVIKSTTKKILNIKLLLMIIYTNSLLLYNYLVKLGSTQEKWVIIDLMCLQQSYKQCEIMEIRWIDRNSNFADTITKVKPYAVLQKLINTNIIYLNTARWLERADGTQV